MVSLLNSFGANVLMRVLVFVAASLGATTSYAATFTAEFWNSNSSFNNINQAISFTENNPVTATFESTGIDYPAGGTNNISSSTTLASFIGADASSIVGDGTATIETSVLRFTGFVDLLPGNQEFIVGSDDGYQLEINGTRISRQVRPRAFGTTTTNTDPGEGRATFELFFFENFGFTGLEVFIDGQIATAAPVPLPAGLPLILTALGALGLLKRRRSIFPLVKTA